MEKPRLIPVGKVIRAHGLRGAVKVYAYGESLAVQKAGAKLILNAPDEREKELTVVSVKAQGKVWMVQFAELTGIEGAQGIVGAEIFLPENRLPPTSDGEYYHYRLIGLKVESLEGEEIGVLRGIIETGGNDVYVVERDGKEVLIPAVVDIICLIDLDKGRMVVDLPDGLV
ncbi:MAG: ribosome maturation factor RimM [Syntrophobacteraceae bacterium]